jgi:hypothetical protein
MRLKSKALLSGIGCLILVNIGQTTALGQEANPLNNLWSRLNQIYVQSNFLNSDDATEVESMLKGAIDRAGTLYGANSEEVLQPTLELCRLYKMQARYGELRAQSKKVAQIYSNLPTASRLLFAPGLLDQARELSVHNRSFEAGMLTGPVLELIRTEKAALDHANVLNKLSEQALILKNRKDLVACEPIYRALLFAYEHKQPGEELILADIRTQLAEILKERGNASAATELAMLALEGREKTGSEYSSKGVSTLILLSELQLKAGKADEARKLADKLDTALKQAFYSEQANLIHPILNLCKQYAQLNDYKSMRTLFSRSLSIADRYSYSHYDASLRDISKYLIASGNTEMAENLHLELLNWAERSNSVADANYRSCVLTMLTRFYAECGQFDKVIPAMINLAKLDADNRLNGLANLQSQLEASNNTAARIKLYELLAAKSAANANERRQVAHYHIKLAEIYLNNRNSNKAKKEWYLITRMLQDSLPQDCKDLAEEVRIILDKYVRENRFQDAQSLANNMTSFGFDQNILTSVSNGFNALSRHQDGLANTDKALKLVERSIAVAEKYGGKETYNYSDALSQYAVLLRKCGKIQQAVDVDKQATLLRAKLQRNGVNRYG